MHQSASLRRSLVAAALSTSALAHVGSAHAQEAVVAPITVAPTASVSFTSTGEPVAVRIGSPSAATPETCRTPCSLSMAPGGYVLETSAPHPARAIEPLNAGPNSFAVNPHGPGYGLGLGLTIAGAVLIPGAVGATFGLAAAAGLVGLVVGGLAVGVPMVVTGIGLLIPGAIVLGNNGPARIERVPNTGAARARNRRGGFTLTSSMVHDQQGAAFSLVGFAF